MPSDLDPIFFCHLPSAGGTTLWHILRDVYGADEVARAGAPEVDDLRSGVALPYYNKRKAIGGHMYLAEARAMFPDRKFFTFLRDPAENIISKYYRHLLDGKSNVEKARLARGPVTFSEYHNVYLEYYSPSGEESPSIERIKQYFADNLHCVGLMERYEDSLFLLGRELGWPSVPTYDRRNIGGNKPEQVSADDLAEIKRNMADTYALYDFGVSLFEERLAKYSFDELAEWRSAYAAAQAERERRLLEAHGGASPFVKTEASIWSKKSAMAFVKRSVRRVRKYVRYALYR